MLKRMRKAMRGGPGSVAWAGTKGPAPARMAAQASADCSGVVRVATVTGTRGASAHISS